MKDATARLRLVPHSVLLLGFSGALPFVLASLLAWAGPPSSPLALRSLAIYGAVILSFMGGVHWGLAMAQGQLSLRRLGVSVLPALVAWPAALAGGVAGLLVLAAAFAVLLAYDVTVVRKGLAPDWYPALRLPLTLVVIISLLMGALAVSI